MTKRKVKVKVKTEVVTNKFHIRVKKCCMSCAFRDLTQCAGTRICSKRDAKVKKNHVCEQWELHLNQRMAGFPRGRIKCKEYLMYVLAVREDEALAIERGEDIEIRTIAQLREAFRENHGEIYEID